ncbi:hypothetical protein Ndes2526B_g03790 [Nannochloris sp. 'desiccata']|nr:hypothetical protein KSW81_005351 [Chlorella desiccata (nom. nud.)]KAH7621441.1 hypothetical protein NADE_006704 [Chlorella desiccata (nom. nud.)]
MAESSGDKCRGIKIRIKDAIKRPEFRASIQASVGYFLLLSILSAPSIWLGLSLPTCLIGPIYAFVSFTVVLQTNVGTALNWVIQRIIAASLAGALGLCCVYITYAANGSTYLPSVTKAAVMTTFTSILGFLIIMGGYRWPKVWFGFIVASLSLPIIALSGFHLSYVEPLTMPYFLMNVCIGVAMAALVSMFVLPITAGSTIRGTTSKCLLLLGQGTKELMEILLEEPIQQQKQHQHSASTCTFSDGGGAVVVVKLTGFIESWANPVSTALVKAKALLVPVATEVDIYHRPVLFPRYAYGCLLDLLRHYMSTLMTLAYLIQGEAPLGAVRTLNNEILRVVERIERCFSTAAEVLESSCRGGGVLDTDEKKAAVLYVEGLDKLTELENALHTLSTNHIDIPCLATSSTTTTSSTFHKYNGGKDTTPTAAIPNSLDSNGAATYTEGEIVMADTVIAIIFALGSRLRRLYFVLPEVLSHRDTQVWEAWRKHYKGHNWDFDDEEPSSSTRQEGRSRRSSREYAEMSCDGNLISRSGDSHGGSPSLTTPSSAFSSAPLQRQVSEVRSPLTSHHLDRLPSLPIDEGKIDGELGSGCAPAVGGDGGGHLEVNEVVQQQQEQSSSSSSSSPPLPPSFFSGMRQRWSALPSLVDIDLPYGFSGEMLVLSLQVGIALAAASIVHVCSASYDALNENTIWVVVTVAVLAQKSVGGLVLRGGNRVIGTVMAGMLGLGVLYFVYLTNGLSYSNRILKFIFMTLSLSILSGILMWGSMRAPIQYSYAWMVCKFTLPIICLVGYSGEKLLPETALWRLLNISIGLAIDLVVTSLVFPQSTKGAVERRVCKVLNDLAEISTATSRKILPARSEQLSFSMSRTSSMPFKWQSPPIFSSNQPQEQKLKEKEKENLQQEVVGPSVNGANGGGGGGGGASGGGNAELVERAPRGEEDKDANLTPLSTKNLHIRTTSSSPTTTTTSAPRCSTKNISDNATLSSSPSYFISSPTKHRSKKKFRKDRTRWLKHVALGKPVLQLRPLGQDAASLLVAIGELEIIASFEGKMKISKFNIFPRGKSNQVENEEKFAGKITTVRRALRRMLNALLSFVYVLDGPDVPHLKLLLQHRQNIDSVMVQLSECLLALRAVASHNKVTELPLDRLLTTQIKLREEMQGLIKEIEKVPPPLRCTQADVVLGFAGLGVLIAAVQTLGELSDAVVDMFASPSSGLMESTNSAGACAACAGGESAKVPQAGEEKEKITEEEDDDAEGRDQFPPSSASSSATSLANKASSSSNASLLYSQQAGNMRWSSSAKVLLGGGGVVGVRDEDEDLEAGLAQGFGHGD